MSLRLLFIIKRFYFFSLQSPYSYSVAKIAFTNFDPLEKLISQEWPFKPSLYSDIIPYAAD